MKQSWKDLSLWKVGGVVTNFVEIVINCQTGIAENYRFISADSVQLQVVTPASRSGETITIASNVEFNDEGWLYLYYANADDFISLEGVETAKILINNAYMEINSSYEYINLVSDTAAEISFYENACENYKAMLENESSIYVTFNNGAVTCNSVDITTKRCQQQANS